MQISSVDEGVEQQEHYYLAGRSVDLDTLEANWQHLLKLNKHIFYDPAILHLSIYHTEMRTCVLNSLYI